MRFSAKIIFRGNPPFKVPLTYKRNITSIIKEAINPQGEETEIYKKYYKDKKQNIQKPFTFSVQIPFKEMEKRGKTGFFILRDNDVLFHFSSSDQVLLIQVYNGLVRLRKDFSPFSGYEIGMKNFYLQKNTPIKSDEIVFKTYSPILVRDIKNKKGKGFISFEHEKFIGNLFFSIRNLCRNFVSRDYELSKEQVEIIPVKCKASIINHYGGEKGRN